MMSCCSFGHGIQDTINVEFIIYICPSVLFFLFNAATYKYCCRGSYCPGCPVHLYLKFAEQKVLVHTGLTLDCRERRFNSTFETTLQDGTYKMNVSTECGITLAVLKLNASDINCTDRRKIKQFIPSNFFLMGIQKLCTEKIVRKTLDCTAAPNHRLRRLLWPLFFILQLTHGLMDSSSYLSEVSREIVEVHISGTNLSS